MEIKIKNLNKTIKGATILKDINITLESGHIYGLKGKNGSGKTMLMRSICGLIKPTSGTININNKKLGKDISFPESIGVLIENPSFIGKYTGFKNLKILASIKNSITDEQIKTSLSDVGLNPNDNRTYRKYSLGMKQRLGVACALMERPDVILLDEPINALDESGVKLVKDLLLKEKERNALIIVACHDKEELEFLSDEIYELHEGKITGHVMLQKNNTQDIFSEGEKIK